ncbi:hypothetical protein [Yersinia intermedia]|uniref:hypothetical protein n=1 Tax=Yersinia intermedia TaxID=631 RepID=UPI003850461F
MIYLDFIQNILKQAKSRVRSYAGGMLVDVVYNRQGDEIAVLWANSETGQTEVYPFKVIDGENYTESVNGGSDFTAYGNELVDNIFQHMVKVESKQTGRPPAC